MIESKFFKIELTTTNDVILHCLANTENDQVWIQLHISSEQFAELHRAMILWFTDLTIKNLEGQP